MNLLQSFSEPSGLLLIGAALLGVSIFIRRLVLGTGHGPSRRPKTSLQVTEAPLE
jgi:hypothetical protein